MSRDDKGAAMCWYVLQCMRGGITTMRYYVSCYAANAADAFEQARQQGYTPLHVETVIGWQTEGTG